MSDIKKEIQEHEEERKGLKKGNKVRCIDDFFVDDRHNPFKASELNLPKAGEVYTVREIVDTGYGLGLRLEEIRNKEYFYQNIRRHEEPPFGVSRFESLYK